MIANDILAGSRFQNLSPSRTALLVIDVQKYFTEPDHPFGEMMRKYQPDKIQAYFKRVEERVIPNIQRLQKQLRPLGVRVAYTEFGSFLKDGSDMSRWARRHNEIGRAKVGNAVYRPFGDASCRVDERVGPNEGELVFQKNTSGPVGSTNVDHVFRAMGIRSVIVAGIVTDVCVAQAARELGDLDFNALVVEDACASMDETLHKAALETINLTFGTVVSTDQAIALLKTHRE